jgi:phage protein U
MQTGSPYGAAPNNKNGLMNQNLMSIGENFFYSPRPGEASPGFQTIDRDSNFSWPQQNRLSRAPAMQFTGPGADLIQIEGRLFPGIFGGLKTMDNLKAAGDKGEPLMLIRYYILEASSDEAQQYVGERVGMYAITRLRKRELKIGGDGLPVYMEFSLELSHFGEDGEEFYDL